MESCSALTNARLVHLILGPYRLKAHLKVLKKFMLHGQVRSVPQVSDRVLLAFS